MNENTEYFKYINDNFYVKKLYKLIKTIGPSYTVENNKVTINWVLTGSMVIYIYSLYLQDILGTASRKPEDVDIICSKAFFDSKKEEGMHNSKMYRITYDGIGPVDFYNSEKATNIEKNTFKNAFLFRNICYFAKINDMLLLKEHMLNTDTYEFIKNINKIQNDINYIGKISAIRFALTNKNNNANKQIIEFVQSGGY